MGAIFRRFAAFLLALAFLSPRPGAALEALPKAPVLRALLVACDDFVSQPDTTPSSYNNLVALRRALLYDARGYRGIRVSVNQALDADSFAALAAEAFSAATQRDISLFYLSTHGIQAENKEDFTALMSDGQAESLLSGKAIHEALKRIPGQKVIILDACYSGAAINKGLERPAAASVFTGSDFKVLTSAGGLEPSFLWTDGAGTVQGGSFFAQALTEGISAEGRFAADGNRDGQITLSELHRHQFSAYGASTPMVYPQNDDFVVFAYNNTSPQNLRTVTGLLLESPVIRQAGEPLLVSYTLNRQARLAYQLIYESQGSWRFQHPQSIEEMGRGDGIVLPGRKEAALQLQPGLSGLSGYLLLLLITVSEDRSRPLACVLMSVQTQVQDLRLRVDSVSSFSPKSGEEAGFILRHTGPVEYSAAILTEQGEAVAYPAFDRMSRPIHLEQEGSCIWWDGRMSGGQFAPAGKYRLKATVQSGGQKAEVLGELFELRCGE